MCTIARLSEGSGAHGVGLAEAGYRGEAADAEPPPTPTQTHKRPPCKSAGMWLPASAVLATGSTDSLALTVVLLLAGLGAAAIAGLALAGRTETDGERQRL